MFANWRDFVGKTIYTDNALFKSYYNQVVSKYDQNFLVI